MNLEVAGACRSMFWSAVLLPFVLLLSAPAPVAAATAATADQRGFVSEGIMGRLLFQRCEAAGLSEQALKLQDKTPDRALGNGVGEVRKTMHEPDRPLYVEFRGEVVESFIHARQFQRAIGHVASCALAPPALPANVQLAVEGGQPTWRLLATPAGTRLEVMGDKPVQFKPVSPSAPNAGDKARVFTAKSVRGEALMRLELTEQPCNDSSTETAYGARVVARVGERVLEGCAARF